MTRAKLLIPVVAAVAAIAGFYFLVLAPKREEITRLDTEIATADAAAQTAESQLATYQKAKDSYRSNYTTIARLGKAVPADDDVRSLLVQIDDAAKESKVSFRSLNLSAAGGTAAPSDSTASPTAGELAPAPGSVPVGSAGFAAMPFNFSFDGSFFRLSDFFQRLERFVHVKGEELDVSGRLMLVGSIALTPQGGENLDNLTAQIGAATYLVPSQQGITAGATPQAPAGATSAATPPSTDDGTVSNTITGVQ